MIDLQMMKQGDKWKMIRSKSEKIKEKEKIDVAVWIQKNRQMKNFRIQNLGCVIVLKEKNQRTEKHFVLSQINKNQ